MKKLLSFILCLVLASSVITALPINGSAEEQKGIVLPEYTLPQTSCATFDETNFPYDEIIALFPDVIEKRYEDGILYVKDLGGDNAYYTDHLNYQGHEGVLVDGYWRFAATLEEYNSGGSISMYTDSHSWHVGYNMETGKRGVISLDYYEDDFSRSIMLYPKEGYGEKYLTVHYDLYSGLSVSDTYLGGALYEQKVTFEVGDGHVSAYYDAEGKVDYLNVYAYESGEYMYFLPDKGWSDKSWEYDPIDAPEGYEDATLQSLMQIVPTDIGCEHQWKDALCDVPSICALCKREKGEPLGHTWVGGDKHDTCSTCNAILYRMPEVILPKLNLAPASTLEKVGIKTDDIMSKVIDKIEVKYENGFFMIPNIDGYDFIARLSDEYVRHSTVDGWNMIEAAEEGSDELSLIFHSKDESETDLNLYGLKYDGNGALTFVDIFNKERNCSITLYPKKDKVEVCYIYEEADYIEYTDIYESGSFSGRLVQQHNDRTTVEYDSDLNVVSVETYIDDFGWVYYVPEKGWFEDSEFTVSIDTPSGYKNKDAAYFESRCPHGIDFCIIHDWKDIKNGKECVKCGEKIMNDSFPVGLIIGIAAGVVVIAAAVTVIVVKKKKK